MNLLRVSVWEALWGLFPWRKIGKILRTPLQTWTRRSQPSGQDQRPATKKRGSHMMSEKGRYQSLLFLGCLKHPLHQGCQSRSHKVPCICRFQPCSSTPDKSHLINWWIFRWLIGQTVCALLVWKKICRHTALSGVSLTSLRYMIWILKSYRNKKVGNFSKWTQVLKSADWAEKCWLPQYIFRISRYTYIIHLYYLWKIYSIFHIIKQLEVKYPHNQL